MPLPESELGRKRYMVPSTKLNLVQISIISAVIFSAADHDGVADQTPTLARLTRTDRVRHDDRADELVRCGDRAANPDLKTSFQWTESNDTSNASTTQG